MITCRHRSVLVVLVTIVALTSAQGHSNQQAAKSNSSGGVSPNTSANEECWENYVNLTTPLALTCTTVIADTMILVGGITACCPDHGFGKTTPVVGTTQVQGMNLMYNANWNLLGNMPTVLRGSATCTSFQQQIVITTAAQDANSLAAPSNEAAFLDPNSLAVLSTSRFQYARSRAALVSTREHIYVIGGVDPMGRPVLHIERTNGTTWETILNATMPLCDCAVAVHDVEIFLVCSHCDTGANGVEGVRDVFVSYCIESNSIMPVVDWPRQYGQGPLLSISGSSIAQYAVFVAVYRDNIWPVAYYWDLYLEQMHVMTTAWLTTPRFSGATFSAVDSIYYVGGQYFPADNVTGNILTQNVDQLPVVEPLTASVFSRENNTYTVGEQVDVRCDIGVRLRISDSLWCHSVAPGTNDDNCKGPDAPLFMPVTAPLPIAFLCVARGTCDVPVSLRRSCGGSNETFRTCNRQYGCCFDSVRNQCFQYEVPNGSERVYFQTGSLVTFTVVSPPPPPELPQPPPSDLTAFVHSTVGILVFTVVGLILLVAAYLIVKFGVLPPSGGSANFSDGFDVIHGKYIIERKLGQGGFGQVFLVKRKTDGERFALKYIPCGTDEDRNFAIKEFELVRASQGHPHMITIHDMFLNWSDDGATPLNGDPASATQMQPKAKDQQQPHHQVNMTSPLLDANRRFVCIVMTYCPGGDLAQYIQKCIAENRRIAEAWILQTLARQMADVLNHLHHRPHPIVHRDLKPENVLLSTDRANIMLTDFGLASQQDQTYMTTRAGSLHYVAPECWKKHYSSTVDLWAVGCILYATATGRVTVTTARVMFNDAKEKGFQKDIRRELVEKHKYSDEFASFVLSLLQVDHKKRLTATAATKWLDDIQAGIPRANHSSPIRTSHRQSSEALPVSSESVDSGNVPPPPPAASTPAPEQVVTPPIRQAADI